jgi:hypothetical protein
MAWILRRLCAFADSYFISIHFKESTKTWRLDSVALRSSIKPRLLSACVFVGNFKDITKLPTQYASCCPRGWPGQRLEIWRVPGSIAGGLRQSGLFGSTLEYRWLSERVDYRAMASPGVCQHLSRGVSWFRSFMENDQIPPTMKISISDQRLHTTYRINSLLLQLFLVTYQNATTQLVCNPRVAYRGVIVNCSYRDM